MMEIFAAWLDGFSLEQAVMIVSALVALLVTLITLALIGVVLCIIVILEDRRDHARRAASAEDLLHLGDMPHMPTILPPRSQRR